MKRKTSFIIMFRVYIVHDGRLLFEAIDSKYFT